MLIAFKKPDLLFLELVELFLIDFLGIQNLSDAKHTPDGGSAIICGLPIRGR